MSSLAIAGGVMLIGAGLIGLLQVEKMVKLAFGSWVGLGISLAVGTGIKQLIIVLGTDSALKIAGFTDFLSNAQPTIMLVVSGLLLWFFVKYGQIRLGNSEDLLQKIVWAVLAMGSLIAMVWASLFTVGGGLYEWLFKQGDLALYEAWFPLFVLVVSLLCLVCASKVNIKFSVSTSVGE